MINILSVVCEGNLKITTIEDCVTKYKTINSNGACYESDSKKIYGIYNKTSALENGIKPSPPAAEFMK